MPFSRPTSLFFIGRDKLLRADFAAGKNGPPLAIAQRDRPDSDDPAVLVAMLAAASSAKLGRVFVLSVDCWVHTMDIVASVLGQMNDAEIVKLISFDAEPLSGINAFDAASAMLPVGNRGTEQRFWFTEISQSTREQFDEAVRQSGGTLAGICHPGCVPLPLSNAAANKTWRRVEFWPNAVIRAAYDGAALMHLQIDEGQTGQDRETVIQAWRKTTGVSDVDEALLSEQRREAVQVEGTHTVSLLDEIALGEWLTRWNKALSAKRPAVPVIRAERRPMTRQQRRNLAACFALAAIVGCYGHHQWVQWGIAQAQAARTDAEAPGKELAALSKQAGDMEKETQKQRDENNKLKGNVEHCERVLAAQRRRLSELFSRLSRMTQEGWVLQEIGGDGREVTLQGITMHPQRISAMSSELSAELHELGWGVDPPRQTAQNYNPNGGPWKFEVKLRDVIMKPAAGSPAATPAVQAFPVAATQSGAGGIRDQSPRAVSSPSAESERR